MEPARGEDHGGFGAAANQQEQITGEGDEGDVGPGEAGHCLDFGHAGGNEGTNAGL